MGEQVLFGARALDLLDGRVARHVLGKWESGASSLRSSLASPLVA